MKKVFLFLAIIVTFGGLFIILCGNLDKEVMPQTNQKGDLGALEVEKNDSESRDVPSNSKVLQTNQSEVVAVRIDGKDLTRSEILRNGKVILQLNMNRARNKNIRKREVQVLEKYCRTAVSREIAKAAVERYIKDRDIQVSTSIISRVTKRFESQYGVMSMKLRRRHKINDLKYMLGKNAQRLDEMIMETARFAAMTNDVIKSTNINISSEEVEKRLKSIKEGNEKVIAITKDIYEKATNVWKKILAKELTFEAAATKYSEDEYISDGCEWGCFTRDQLDGEDALLALLPNLKAGDITPPLDSDAGLAIIRKDQDDNDKTFSFSRVFFKLPYFYEEETYDEAREVLIRRKQAELIKKVMDENTAKLKIEYPDGTNMVWKITQKDFK